MFDLFKVVPEPFGYTNTYSRSWSFSGSQTWHSSSGRTDSNGAEGDEDGGSVSESGSGHIFSSVIRNKSVASTYFTSSEESKRVGEEKHRSTYSSSASAKIEQVQQSEMENVSTTGRSQDTKETENTEDQRFWTTRSTSGGTEYVTTNVSGLVTVTTKNDVLFELMESVSTGGTTPAANSSSEINISRRRPKTEIVSIKGEANHTYLAERERLFSLVAAKVGPIQSKYSSVKEVVVNGGYLSRSYPTIKIRVNRQGSAVNDRSTTIRCGFSTVIPITSTSSAPLSSYTLTTSKWAGTLPMETGTQSGVFASVSTYKTSETLRFGMGSSNTNSASDSPEYSFASSDVVWSFPTVTLYFGLFAITEVGFYTVGVWSNKKVFHPVLGMIDSPAVVSSKQHSFYYTSFEEPNVLYSKSDKFGGTNSSSTSNSNSGGSGDGTFRDMNSQSFEYKYTHEDEYDEGVTHVVEASSMVTLPMVLPDDVLGRTRLFECGFIDGTRIGLGIAGAEFGGTYVDDQGEVKTRPEILKAVPVSLGLSSLMPETNSLFTLRGMSLTSRPNMTVRSDHPEYDVLTTKTVAKTLSVTGEPNYSVKSDSNLWEAPCDHGTLFWNIYPRNYSTPDGSAPLFYGAFSTRSFAASKVSKVESYRPVYGVEGVRDVQWGFTSTVAVGVVGGAVNLPREAGVRLFN